MNPALEAARNGFPTAQSRSYSAGTASSSALAASRTNSHSHSSAQTTRRHTMRSSVSNVDDELSSLFNVALGTPSHRRGKLSLFPHLLTVAYKSLTGIEIVPLHQRELPASFWSPKKNVCSHCRP
jgi:hypothetical protein